MNTLSQLNQASPDPGRLGAPNGPCTSSPVIDSQVLLRGQKEALIAHNGVTYRLQATRQGKLILTK